MKYSIDSKMRDLIKNQKAKEIMEHYFPGSTTDPQMKLCYGMSYRKILSFPQVGATPELFETIDKEFKSIEG